MLLRVPVNIYRNQHSISLFKLSKTGEYTETSVLLPCFSAECVLYSYCFSLPLCYSGLDDPSVEGLDMSRQLQTGEMVIIMTVLIMWAGTHPCRSQWKKTVLDGFPMQ